jgi:hypothetical protein
MKISRGDQARIALAPAHVAIGALLTWRFFVDARTPMVLVLGLSFIAFGVYRIALIGRALRGKRD